MKTVLPFKTRSDRQEEAVFYHSKEVCITQEIRPVPEYWNASKTVCGVETPMTEMEFFVLRFPKAWYKQIKTDGLRFGSVRIWNKLDNEIELLVPTDAYISSTFELLAESGFFRYTDKLLPLPGEGLYLPYYQTPVRFWHSLSNFFGVLMSIPQVSWMAYQEQKAEKAKGVKS